VPARILLILPNQVDRLLYEEALPALGFEADSATCMSEALERIDREPPDIVILDEQVEMADGSDPIETLRAACPAPVVLSAWCSSERSRLLALKRGADDALPKPPERVALATTLRCLYQVKQKTDRAREQTMELTTRLQIITDRVDNTVRVLRNSLSTAVLGVGYLQEVLEGRDEPATVAHALEDASTALGNAVRALDTLAATVHVDVVARDLDIANIDLAEFIDQVSQSRQPHALARQIDLGVEVPDGLELFADRDVLTRLTYHLLDESLRQTGVGGRVLLRARPDADQVEIVVRCSRAPGPPSPADRLERPTLPAQLMPENRESGLEFCRQAVLAQGGSMRVEHDPEWPVSYVVRLPRLGVPSLVPRRAARDR
jgi:two-component system sensor histidine kinase/response regulator